ncbi:MAG: hypothetical protein K9N47_11310 [Prosthecobacter sp.]|uniref:hypothetical protein n=1 Tax=Prosthecobacter sp. TaxID=1965333 RepID=UPI0025D1D9E1|nr:hypothetical protein [Prosthecobacter sp.]MCF7786702.1 hypothetical protein [Prosthecobacter sp.]
MRLSHYALALTIILLAITGYLAWEAQEEAKGARKELELVRRQQAAHEMAMPSKPDTVTNLPPPPEVQATTLPPLAGSDLMPGTPATYASPAAAAAPLTDLQKQLLGMPAFAKVLEVNNEGGFAVISAGRDKDLASGMKFDVRRGNGLVGRVIVGETIEAAQAVVDVDNTVILPGVHIEAGDELILPIRK